jgi:hypothetical protein
MFWYLKLQYLHTFPEAGKMFIGQQQFTVMAFNGLKQPVAIAQPAA